MLGGRCSMECRGRENSLVMWSDRKVARKAIDLHSPMTPLQARGQSPQSKVNWRSLQLCITRKFTPHGPKQWKQIVL
jgi:hypothetical protein